MRFEDLEVEKSYTSGTFERVHKVVYIDNELRKFVTNSDDSLDLWDEEDIKSFNFKPADDSDYQKMLISEFKDKFKQLTNKEVEVIIKNK